MAGEKKPTGHEHVLKAAIRTQAALRNSEAVYLDFEQTFSPPEEGSGFPCLKCGYDCSVEADACAADSSFEFKCPHCGFVDHI